MNNKNRLNFEKLFELNTEVNLEWPRRARIIYNPTESTEYEVLDKLVKEFQPPKGSKLIDFGCGTGRALLYLHYYWNIKSIGIELMDEAFDILEINYDNYLDKINELNIPHQDLDIFQTFAEHYEIEKDANIFYFFNPFSPKIFQAVINNILNSLIIYPRDVYIILYYPDRKYLEYVSDKTQFKLYKSIDINSKEDNREKILIFKRSSI